MYVCVCVCVYTSTINFGYLKCEEWSDVREYLIFAMKDYTRLLTILFSGWRREKWNLEEEVMKNDRTRGVFHTNESNTCYRISFM